MDAHTTPQFSSPRHSPDLGYASPVWHHPQAQAQAQYFARTPSYDSSSSYDSPPSYDDSPPAYCTSAASPVTPPASDGLLSPPQPGHEFAEPAPGAWAYPVKAEALDLGAAAPQFLGGVYAAPFLAGAGDEYAAPARARRRQPTQPTDSTVSCDKCGRHFTRVYNLNTHLATHQPDRPRPHVCARDGCGKRFARRTDLTRHAQCVHEKLKRFECPLCKSRFARKDTLSRWVLRVRARARGRG